MGAVTERFFSNLAERGHEPLLDKVSGRVAFHLARGASSDDWLVTIDHGRIGVRHASARPGEGADSLISADPALFDRIAAGQVNALAAVLRGTVTVAGDLELLVLFQRLFPGRSTGGPAPGSVGRSKDGPARQA